MPEIAPQYTLQALERGFVMAPMLDGLRITSGVELASVDAPPDYRAVRRLVPIARTYADVRAFLEANVLTPLPAAAAELNPA